MAAIDELPSHELLRCACIVWHDLTIGLSTSLRRMICIDVLASSWPCPVSSLLIIGFNYLGGGALPPCTPQNFGLRPQFHNQLINGFLGLTIYYHTYSKIKKGVDLMRIEKGRLV